MRRFAPLVLICATAFGAPAALQISSTTAPAGGFAQIAIYAVKPMAISSGHLVLTLDATAFGTGAMVGLFGANGDASGLATTTGAQIDVQFSSLSGGIGQLAGLPVMVFSVPVLASAAGKTVTVTATSPDSSVTVGSGSVTVQGTLSVGKIPAGMGVVPAGTVVPVTGTGFTSSTTVSIDGVVLSSAEFISSTEIDATIGGPTGLVGKVARVTDSGVEFDYFCFQPNDPVNFPESTGYGPEAANTQALFPLSAELGAVTYTDEDFGGVAEIQNPNTTAAIVSIFRIGDFSPFVMLPPVTIPPGSWAIVDGVANTDSEFISNVPVRIVAMNFAPVPPSKAGVVPATVSVVDFAAPSGPALTLSPPAVFFGWQIGTPAPAAQTVSNNGGNGIMSATVTDGGSWLSVALKSTGPSIEFGGNLTVSVNPAPLSAGTYQGSIFVTQTEGPSRTLPVTLTVANGAPPMISAAPLSLSFTAPSTTATPYSQAAPYSQTISITSSNGPAPFTVSALAGGGPESCCYAWLKVSATSGTTPATITVTWDPSVTSQLPYFGQPSTSASILISGPANSITISATFNVTGVQTYQTSQGAAGLGPNGLVFSAQTGTAPQMQVIEFYPPGTATLTVSQPWMNAAVLLETGLANGEVGVTVNPAGLAPGVYGGSVTIAEQGIAPISVPVTLGVWSTPPPLTSTVSSMTFVQQVGEPPPPNQTTEIDSGGVPVPLTFASGSSWLNLIDRFTLTPAPVQVGVIQLQTPMPPGQYNGSFTVQSPGGSVYVPVTLLVEPGPITPPVVASVVNAASGTPGAVSPGEIVSVRGYGVGAAAVSSAVGTKLNGLQVTFDGTPATLFYTSANQTNLVVPQGVSKSTLMQVTSDAGQPAAWVLPVVGVTPGIFTIDGTGTGQGAIVNQDGTVNSAANPAARGSIVSIYMTGQGGASPALTGILPTNVSVTIGEIATTVQYAGQAPGEIAGLTQVNAVVPQGVAAGPAVPVVVGIGGVQSQAGVTMAVK